MSVFVIIESPLDVNSNFNRDLIKKYAKSGVRSTEILLKMSFVTTDDIVEEIFKRFKVIKNKVYFQLKNG